MKKLLCMTLLSLFAFTYAEDEKRSPELEELITVNPIEDKDLEGNLYVGLMGMFLPQDNFLEITKRYFKQNEEILLSWRDKMDEYDSSDYLPLSQFIPEGSNELKVDLDGYAQEEIFPCMQYLDESCIEKVIQNQSILETILKKNQTLLRRYKAIITTATQHKMVGINHAFADFVNYPQIVQLNTLIQHDALLKLTQGDEKSWIEQMKMLRSLMALYFYSDAIESDPVNLMVNLMWMQIYSQSLNAALSSGLLNDQLNNPDVKLIMMPLSARKMGIAVQKAGLYELESRVKAFAPMMIAKSRMVPKNIKLNLSSEERYIITEALMPFSYFEFLSPIEKSTAPFLQIETLSWQKVKERDQIRHNIDSLSIELLQAKSFKDQSQLRAQIQNETTRLKEWYERFYQSLEYTKEELANGLRSEEAASMIPFLNRYSKVLWTLGWIMKEGDLLDANTIKSVARDLPLKLLSLNSDAKRFEYYADRTMEQQNYAQLVYLKYRTMKDNIAYQDIPSFLESMGDLAKNTLTKEPFQFESEKGILSTTMAEDNQLIPSNIRNMFQERNTELERRYQVTIENERMR